MTATGLDELHPDSLAARDYAQHQNPADVEALFARAAQTSGRNESQMQKEVNQGNKWPGQMTKFEYVNNRLYELDKGLRKEFISDWLHWPIHEFCSDEEASEKTVDKWQCTDVLERAGIATIPIVAMVDRAAGTYGETPKIGTADGLGELLRSTDLPLFAKPNRLLGSFGAFRIDAIDGNHVVLNDGEQVPLDEMIPVLMSDAAYVLQRVVANHADIRAFCDGLATLRTVNLVSDGSVRMARAVFKIPVGGNIADNSWRDGNLTANVNPANGVVDRVIRGAGPDLETFTHHPDTDTPLVGMTLPFWDEVVALNTQTAQEFGAISYQSQDIAITDDGPLVVEVNSGASFVLPQMASGRGFLTKENKAFFESCGVNFRKLPKV